jgi:hypothetical protein
MKSDSQLIGDFAAAIATNQERDRIFKLLAELGVLEESKLGDDWRVIYTSTGAMDITLNRLKGGK